MKMWIPRLMLLASLSVVSYGQAAPTAVAANGTGPSRSWVDGTVHYSLSASELLQLGYYGPGNLTQATSLSGNVGYVSKSVSLPFSMLFAGGVLFGNQSGQGTQTFENVALSQGLVRGKWIFGVNDSFSYLPQSPTTGLSGIPGVGDLGSQPVDGPSLGPAGGVLTYAGNRISNALGGNVERRLTGATSINGTSNWSILRFLNNSGLDNSQITGQVGVNHRIDARNSAGVNAAYSVYESSGNTSFNQPTNVNFQTKGLNVQYRRLWTRALTMDVSVGPQWISSPDAAVIPAAVNLATNINFGYTRKSTSMGVNYTRAVNGGSGVQPGALADSISGSVGRPLGRKWMAAMSANYTHTDGLLATSNGTATTPINAPTKTFYSGAQLTRGFGRYWSGFVSYSAQDQSINSYLVRQNAFSGFSQTFGFGITYAPKSTRLGEF